MRKLLLITLLSVLSMNLFCQNRDILFQETFDSTTLPTTWSITGLGAANWMIAQSCNAGGEPNELQFGWTPPCEGISRVTTEPIDLSGITSAKLSLLHSVDVYEGSSTIGFATSSDNGNTWNTVWSQSYDTDGTYVVDTLFNTPDLGKDNVKLCLFFEGNSYNVNFWFFDNIIIQSQNQLDINLTSINNHEYTVFGENAISFTARNSGETLIESFEASYTIDDEVVTETFYTNLSSMESATFTFETMKELSLGSHNLSININSVNGIEDEISENNYAEKIIVAASNVSQKTPLIEHFSSSTCGPCVEINAQMEELTNNNIGKFTYVKYAMDWPASGDPYYNNEGGVRRDHYGVTSVPSLYLDGEKQLSVISQENLNYVNNIPSIVNIKGAFNMEGNTINITADFMSYIDLDNVEAFVSINEKTTKNNTGSNGETEFHHIMMKMLDDADGNEINISAGSYQRLEFSYDMSSTFVEELNDLEVALWIQDITTDEVYNSSFAYEYTGHAYPVEDIIIEKINEDGDLHISWNAPDGASPSGYNLFVDNEQIIDNSSETSYDIRLESGMHVVEVVALYDDKSSVGIVELYDLELNIVENEVADYSIYPNPAKDFVRISANNGQLSSVKIYNVIGVMIEQIEVYSKEIEINISDYNPGVYFFNINGEVVKIIKN